MDFGSVKGGFALVLVAGFRF